MNILLKLDHPSEIMKKYISDMSYALIIDSKDMDKALSTPVISYGTNEDLIAKRGVLTYLCDIEDENIFEYDASVFEGYDN
jgi:hypothetical protein